MSYKVNVAVVGIGYVGLATAVFWKGGHENVMALDVVQEKVDAVNDGRCPFADTLIEQHLRKFQQAGNPLEASLNEPGALASADMVFVAVPTNYSEELGRFDTSIVDGVLAQVASECPDALVVLRSTMQPGNTEELACAHGLKHVLYSPEFLREGRSFDDCLHPNRVVLGCNDETLAASYQETLSSAYQANGVPVPPIVNCSLAEAEAAKLFANAYLATRVAFFNELDSYAMSHGLDASSIVRAVCLDERIGGHYNNPSFGYGGYCLPKDTKALRESIGDDAPNALLSAVIEANAQRKDYLAETVLALNPKRIGFYRLVAKHGSDNLRSSATLDLMNNLVDRGAEVMVYEPLVNPDALRGVQRVASLEELANSCDIILANRLSEELLPYQDKVFTRDLYNCD